MNAIRRPEIYERIEDSVIDGRRALRVSGLGDYSLSRTLDCGQCFRFEPYSGGGFVGVAHGRALHVSQPCEGELILYDVDISEYMSIWRRYFSVDKDWDTIARDISGRSSQLALSAQTSRGIRILTQEHFETLISFIISQCNNIPRIKGLVAALCERYGERIPSPGGTAAYSFPTAQAILAHPLSELTKLRVGYRDSYIYEAARASEEGLLEAAASAETTSEAERIITSIRGVGRKVAACTLLFGFERYDAFPVDVWMKRALARLFPGQKDYRLFGPYAGVAQQYMFYSERYLGAPDAPGEAH